MRLFDLTLRLNGIPINKAKAALSHVKRLDDHAFEIHLDSQKREIVSFHLNRNPFYRLLAQDTRIDDWNTVPVMTKQDLQKPLKLRLSEGFSKSTIYINKTSGSSGDPFIFAKDKWCHALTWAVIMDRFSWFGIDFNKSKQARFYGIPLRGFANFKERLKDLLSNRVRFSVFDLSDHAFQNCLKSFEKTSFSYINGYTSPIVQFAKFLMRRNIILKSVCPSLEYCFVTSEMLFEDDKALMEHFFGVPVINEYGASELDLIAFENRQKEFLINSETLYVEILDEQDNVLSYGEEGRIVITSLFNKAHPFIRYDIGDVGIISEVSTLKKPILKKLVGRSNDIALLPSGKKAAGLTFYYITKSIIEDDGNIQEFIIDQLTMSHFRISYVSQKPLTDEKKAIIKKEMEIYLESGIDITFERIDRIKRSKSGKLKQFTSYLNLSS